MIPAFLIKRYGPTLAKVIFWGIAAVLVIALLSVAKYTYDQTAETRIKVANGQAGAAQESGHDAVNTVGNVMANEAAGDTITKENADAIGKAKGADVAVDPGVRAVGVSALCRRKSYSDAHPSCVQQPPAR